MKVEVTTSLPVIFTKDFLRAIFLYFRTIFIMMNLKGMKNNKNGRDKNKKIKALLTHNLKSIPKVFS